MMKPRLAILLGATLALSSSACEKAAPSSNGSGAMTTAENELLAHLPRGANVVFGGNLFNMQKRLAESALGRLSAQTTPPALTAWNSCLAAKDMTLAGTGTLTSGEIALRFFLRGPTLPEMEACAKSAGMPATADPDGKFLRVEMTNQGLTSNSPYLAVDGGVYGVVSMSGLDALARGEKPVMKEVSRAELEAEVAGLAQGNAATDPTIVALLPKVDRRKMIWFAGSAEGTQLADKIVRGYGSFSLDRGLEVDVTVKPAKADDEAQVLSQWREVRSKLDQMPANMGALKDAIRSIKVTQVADGVRVVVALTDEQIDAIAGLLGPMMMQRLGQ